MLRAERMSDCIFNGTAKRPPMGLSEVMLTLVDPELANAVAAVMDAPESETPAVVSETTGPVIVEDQPQPETKIVDGFIEMVDGETAVPGTVRLEPAPASDEPGKPWKKRGAEKPALGTKAGDCHEGRRDCGGAAAVSFGAERILDQWACGAIARRAGTFHGNGAGPGQLRDHRAGTHRADSEFEADGSAGDY